MQKISWVTPSYFVDVDLPILVELQNQYKIDWQVVVIGKVSKDLKEYINMTLSDNTNIRLHYIEILYKVWDLRIIPIYYKIIKKAKEFSPDFYYTSLQGWPYGAFLFKLFMPLSKTVAACHNVSTPKGANRESWAKVFTDLHLRTFKNIQVFSDSQKEILNSKYSHKNVLLAPLAIKDYGTPTVPIKIFDKNNISFLFFGIIKDYKRVDLLINAAQSLYEEGYNNFSVTVAGSCDNWAETYAPLIKYPHLFKTRIERIPNSDVANLFAQSDYFVMPYQDIAQSGAITVAYRYNLPIISSNLPQFKGFSENNITGYLFESENMESLKTMMKRVIEGGKQEHDNLQKSMSVFVNENFSINSIANKYIAYFDQLSNLTK